MLSIRCPCNQAHLSSSSSTVSVGRLSQPLLLLLHRGQSVSPYRILSSTTVVSNATLTTTPVSVYTVLPGKAHFTSKASQPPPANYVARVKNDKIFSELTGKGRSAFSHVVVNFSASWCGPCRMMGPIFKAISEECPNALFLKVDIEDCPQTARAFSVASVPTVVVLNSERNVVKRIVGLEPYTIRKDIKSALKQTA